MRTDRAFTKTILFSAATLSLFGCEKMGEESPMAVEIQPVATGPLLASLSSSPDIVVNTTWIFFVEKRLQVAGGVRKLSS
jgi:hypothetical protein